MLSRQEKKEMLLDAKSKRRREQFQATKKQRPKEACSFDEYLSFLSAVQKIFSPSKISRKPTPARLNKL